MKAIVLTYDRNQVITGHMLACYRSLWPDHPFTFRIPCNETVHERYAPEPAEYILSPPAIRQTVLTLLSDLPDEEWIYWCIDDKYPVQLNLEPIRRIFVDIREGKAEGISGVLFCRARRMLDPDYLTSDRAYLGGEWLVGRKAYHQIWVHQFVRAGVIRHLFSTFPEVIESAHRMDPMKDSVVKPDHHRLFVTERNLAVFGESTLKGVLTENCAESLAGKGIPYPDWHTGNTSSRSLIGTL